jgi:hypothetical protein
MENDKILLLPQPENTKVISQPKPEPAKKEREIAYTINDKYFKGFEVVKSANAWWIDRRKVEGLINDFKQGYNLKQACMHNEIEVHQYKYFIELHPQFSTIRELCEEVVKMMTETAISSDIQRGKGDMVRWYAERRMPEKYGKHLAEGLGIGTNVGTINNIKLDMSKVPDSVIERILFKKYGNGTETSIT